MKVVQGLDDAAKLFQRCPRLGLGNDVLRYRQPGAELLRRPIEKRLPLGLLVSFEFLGALGPVAQQIGCGVFDRMVDYRLTAVFDPVDGGAGKTGDRHGLGPDVFVLVGPFPGHRLDQPFTGKDQRIAFRCMGGTAVEGQRESAAGVWNWVDRARNMAWREKSTGRENIRNGALLNTG